MSKRQNDIERYLSGKMTSAEMHALEKKALNDPFLSDALEGGELAGKDNFLFDLKTLQGSIYQRTRSRKPKTISLWNWSLGIAAGLLLLAVSGVYLFSRLATHKEESQLMAAKESPAEEPSSKETPKVAADSVSAGLAADQQLSYDKPSEKQEAKKATLPRRKPAADPTLSPAAVATADDEIATSRAEQVTLTEPVEREAQRIVEADLTGAADVIEAQKKLLAKTDEGDKDKSKGSDAKRDAVPETTTTQPLQGRVSGIQAAASQPATITQPVHGKVTSAEDGTALPGVNVLVKGTSVGTVTDAEGNYQIAMTGSKQNLVFSFIGLQDVEVKPEDNKEVNVQMSPDYAQLSEVVVTGYGTENKPSDAIPLLRFAEPQGGRGAFEKYLEEKMHYPEQALENKVEGRVTVQFTVDTNGQLVDFKVLKGIGFGCDDEVIRLIKEGPGLVSSKQDDKPVKDKVKVRLKFDLPD